MQQAYPGATNQRARQAANGCNSRLCATDTAHLCTTQYFNSNVKQRASLNERLYCVMLNEISSAPEGRGADGVDAMA
jgi:hypothetical protein